MREEFAREVMGGVRSAYDWWVVLTGLAASPPEGGSYKVDLSDKTTKASTTGIRQSYEIEMKKNLQELWLRGATLEVPTKLNVLVWQGLFGNGPMLAGATG